MDMHGKAAYVKVAPRLDVSLSGILLKTDGRLDVGMTCILKIEWKGRAVNSFIK
jgi:hypothetical protein